MIYQVVTINGTKYAKFQSDKSLLDFYCKKGLNCKIVTIGGEDYLPLDKMNVNRTKIEE